MKIGSIMEVTLHESGKTFAVRQGKILKISKTGQITIIFPDKTTRYWMCSKA